jgi:hypothetical protein
MSLHVLTEETAWNDEPKAAESGDGRSYEGRASCRCGWIGEWRGGELHAMHRHVRSEYREHVEAALGPDAYYAAPVACRNCGAEQEQPILVGTYVTSNPCARCGTTMLSPNNDAWNESREQSKRWSW